jgi:hypothetical protein
MGLIHMALFATLDLVGQSPGGPDEDPVGFSFGGWQAPLMARSPGHRSVRRTRARTPPARPAHLRHLRRILAAPERRDRHAFQQRPEVRRFSRQA